MSVFGDKHFTQAEDLFDRVRAVGAWLAGAVRRRPPKQLVGAVEIVLAGCAGILVALTLYAFFAPLPTPERLPLAGAPRIAAAAQAVRANANPFRPAILTSEGASYDSASEEELEETDLNLVLHGVRVDAKDRTAIIRLPDGLQKSFKVGDKILDGVVLNDAYQDQVTITRNGVRETLTLINRDPKTARRNARAARGNSKNAASAKASSKSPGLRADSLDDLANFIRIAPIPSDDGLRIVLNPGADPSLFNQSGLKAGDELVEIDGRDVTQNIASAAGVMQSLSPGAALTVTVNRNGEFVPLTLNIPRLQPSTN